MCISVDSADRSSATKDFAASAVRFGLGGAGAGGQCAAADFLAHEGIETYIDSQHAIAHNKIMIIDHRTVLTGSFNFTKAAEANNAENLLIVRDVRAAAE